MRLIGRWSEDFATRTPEVLGRHAATADLALEIDRLNILSSMDCRFTVAVVGQMRVGKSTLLVQSLVKNWLQLGSRKPLRPSTGFAMAKANSVTSFGCIVTAVLKMWTWIVWANGWGMEKRPAGFQYLDFFADTSFSRNVAEYTGDPKCHRQSWGRLRISSWMRNLQNLKLPLGSTTRRVGMVVRQMR